MKNKKNKILLGCVLINIILAVTAYFIIQPLYSRILTLESNILTAEDLYRHVPEEAPVSQIQMVEFVDLPGSIIHISNLMSYYLSENRFEIGSKRDLHPAVFMQSVVYSGWGSYADIMSSLETLRNRGFVIINNVNISTVNNNFYLILHLDLIVHQ